MVSQEFQAIIMAGGKGSRFHEITGERPKCLVPVGPYPLLYYTLKMLQSHNFSEAIVITIDSQKSEIQQAIEKCPLKIKPEFVAIPSDSDFGTADALNHIHDKVKSDVLIVSCDVITNASLYPLFNIFRQHDASVALLLLPGGAENSAIVPGPKTKYKPERDLIGIHPTTERLLFLASTSDYEETLKLSGHLLRKNGDVVVHSRLVDSHIYLFKKWVIDFLSESEEGFSTIKGELLPYIVKKQMSRPVYNGESYDTPPSEVNMNNKIDDIFNFITLSDLDTKILGTTLCNDSTAKSPYNSDVIRCYTVSAPKESFGIRVNTLLGYCAANQSIFNIWDSLHDQKFPAPLISPTSIINSNQITQCAIGDNTIIAEKTSLKVTVLGSNCVVNQKVRISDSILMKDVTIEEGVVIENCIICDKAVIKMGSVLKNCLIGPNFTVVENTTKEKAHLSNDADVFMEIE